MYGCAEMGAGPQEPLFIHVGLQPGLADDLNSLTVSDSPMGEESGTGNQESALFRILIPET